MASVGRRMARGAVWMVLFKLVERSLGLVSTLILARLLVPADFGVVAMAMSSVLMAELLSAFGFDIAIIQHTAATEDHYHSAWTCNVMLGATITVLMLLLAGPIARFYQHPELSRVVSALAFGPLISGAENIGIVAFRKELNFRREFLFQVSRRIVYFAVVVPLAFLLRNHWALVIGTLVSKSAATAISFGAHPFRPRFTLSRAKELVSFSRWLLFNNLVAFLKERLSDFFIGRAYGAAPLGAYNIAYEFSNLPTTELRAPINRALVQGFARMSDLSEVRRAYAQALGLLALFALPAAAAIFALAPFIVPVVLGQQWLDTVPLMQLLAFNGVLLMFQSSMRSVLIGRGQPDRVSKADAAYLVVLLIAMACLVVPLGVAGAAVAVLVTSVVATPVYLVQLQRAVGFEPRLFFKAVVSPLVASLLMAGALEWELPTPTSGLAANTAWLAAGLALAAAFYLSFLSLIWLLRGRPAGAERMLLELLRRHVALRSSS